MFRLAILAALVASATAFVTPVSRVARATKPMAVRMNDDVAEKVKGIIAEQLGVDAEKVTPDASFTEDLGADSLDAVEVWHRWCPAVCDGVCSCAWLPSLARAQLIMAMEEAFGVEIPDEEAEKLTTPAQCVELISSKQ